MEHHSTAKTVLSRAQGCLLGQCAGDAPGQMVEFRTKSDILDEYPDGVHDMEDGGAFNTFAGQPTNDTEMALMLARSIVKEKKFNARKVFDAYRFWYESCLLVQRSGKSRTRKSLPPPSNDRKMFLFHTDRPIM